MPQFGSNPSVSAQNLSATQDPNGNPIISSENGFGASPLGVAARTQALYGIPNAHFDLTCPDPDSEVEVNNAIPYWDLEYSGAIATTMVYDATTQNWSVRMDPTGAEADDYAILKARTYLLNDSDLALRQKAFASLTKVGTTGTAQWSIVLSATYYDIAGTQLSTYNIGTAADTGTWTGISGVTTSGSAAISTSAAYADIALTLTAAGSVSGTAKVDINSVLIATSQAAGGASSFVITETFTSSGTWTVPTGVEYVSVVAMSGGASGNKGDCVAGTATSVLANGGGGGASGQWVIVRDIALGTATSVSVGVGAGGVAGTALTFTKAAAGTATTNQSGSHVNGGATTFGSYISVPGGIASDSSPGTITYNFLSAGGTSITSAFGGQNGGTGFIGNLSGYSAGVPFTTFVTGGAAGANGSRSGGSTGTATNGAAATAGTGIAGGGGSGGGVTAASSPTTTGPGIGGAAGSGSGGGGAGARTAASSQTITLTGGNGGNATAKTGAGGGGGGGVSVAASSAANYNSSTITMTSGKGGNGGDGFLTIIWVG